MGLSEWCQTHTFEDFLNLMKEDTMNELNTAATQEFVTQPDDIVLDEVIKKEIAEGTPVISTEDGRQAL